MGLGRRREMRAPHPLAPERAGPSGFVTPAREGVWEDRKPRMWSRVVFIEKLQKPSSDACRQKLSAVRTTRVRNRIAKGSTGPLAKSVDAPERTVRSESGAPIFGSRWWKASWFVEAVDCHG
jgi:hypothetical protein